MELILSLGALFKYKEASQKDKDNLGYIQRIIVATACLGFVLLLGDLNFTTKHISAFFIFTGLVLLVTKFVQPKDKPLTIGRSVIIGLSQLLGVLPGVSRSGMTISASLMSGIKREKAAEFSFLLSIPAILAALFNELKDADSLFSQMDIISVSAGFITSIIVGFVSLMLLVKLIKGGRFFLFSFYLIPLGIYGLLFL